MRVLQIIVPFFIAGFGTCFAGILLDHVQFWEVFVEVDQLFLLLPALLGLKGNLQMTLASRFSTHSHLGHIQTKEDLLRLTCANLSLNQFLSIIISLSASILVTLIHLVTADTPYNMQHTLLLIATALLTSSVTSFLLDLLMIMVVRVSASLNINPDNVATPLAASLGDMTALVLCSLLANMMYHLLNTEMFYWISATTIAFYVVLMPFWLNIAQDNPHTENILKKASHWYPLLTAMVISTISGIILRNSVSRSVDIALFQPVICGIGGNLVAVQASRLATLLHRNHQLGKLPEGEAVCGNPLRLIYSKKPGYSITRLLIAMVIPGQIIFYFFCISVTPQRNGPSVTFLLLYLFGSQVHVIMLLYLAHVLTYLLWSLSVDPDNCTIPYLTSISDVLGACIATIICLVAIPLPTEANHVRFSHSM